VCPHCSQDSDCHGYRSRSFVSLLGPVRFSRHYYHCQQCHKGSFPLDSQLGLQTHDRSPATEEVACLAGVQTSNALAAEKVLTRLTGLRLSESTILRATEGAGQKVADAQAAGQTFGPAVAWDWHKDAEGKTVAYVSVDATGIGMQGPEGAKAEGRMITVGMIDNPVPEDRQRWANPEGRCPSWQARYVAQELSLVDLGVPLRKQGGQVGMDKAERWIALSDGGNGLEDFLRVNFGRVDEVILDFWHAAESLGDLAKALHPGEEKAADRWLQQWCHRLKHEGGTVVVEALKALAVGTAAARTRREEVVRYFEGQVQRMDYPRYVAKGWQIGSGPVESACKTVIGRRRKGGGMRWGEDGADAVAICEACSEGKRDNGKHSGAKTNPNFANLRDAHPLAPDRNVLFSPR
jgi:hypothetical protein